MCILNIEATPSENLSRYKLAIDRKRVRMGANNRGTFNLPDNSCDDGTQHLLTYALVGPTGAKLSIKVVCDDETEVNIEGVEIYPEGEPFAAGFREFVL